MDGAIPAPVVEVTALRSPGAAIGYLGLHHRKPQQAPPRGWQGMVERHSHSYFARPVAKLREQARAELAAEWIAERDGIVAEAALARRKLRGDQRDRAGDNLAVRGGGNDKREAFRPPS